MEETCKLLERLTEADGIPGFEQEVRQILRDYLAPVGTVDRDQLGSFIVRRDGGSRRPRVMMAAHMDEIGFVVKSVTADGFLKFAPLGGWWDQVLLAQRVVVKGRHGDIPGVVGSKPPHVLDDEERKKPVKVKQMFIDIGASGAGEVEEWGVRPGDPVVPRAPFTSMRSPGLVMAKALDDRVGCAVMIQTFRDLISGPHPNTLYGVGTVQEEVGLRGAGTSVYQVQPDVAIVLDVTVAGDVPGLKEEGLEKLGGGPAVGMFDASMIPNARLRDLCLEVAQEQGLQVQYAVLEKGGTDGGRIHLFQGGVPTVVIGVPVRYIHSHTGMVNLGDMEGARTLVGALVRRLDATTVQELVV